MGGMRRHDSPTGVKKGHVGFPEGTPVTGYSRPLTNNEHWVLYYFEMHAAECNLCRNPLKVHRAGGQLCDDGHELAIDVAGLLFKVRDGDVYAKSTRENQRIRVEVPAGYKQTMQLFQAIHRSTNFVRPSQPDYPIPPRRSSRRSEEYEPSKPKYNTRIVDPALPEPPRRRNSIRIDSDKSKRGSIYEDDLAELQEASLRERQSRYSYEVREPSYYRH